ncbi:MAG: hypothetical protein M3N52_11170, partial [Actinomycetota bacterium]|nr:hypothetical protein [Actinomycetota bacterium]
VEVRGRGLLQALVLRRPVASAVVGAALERGLVVNDVAPDAIRLAPALILTERDLDEMAMLLDQALAEVGRGARG